MRFTSVVVLSLLTGCPSSTPTVPSETPVTGTPTDAPPTLPSTCTVLTNALVAVDTELLDVCYTIESSLSITAAVVVPAGTIVTVNPDVYVSVQSGGSLTVNGTEAAPVRFQGTGATPSTWGGIGFLGSNSIENRLSYLEIDGAGSEPWTGSSTSFGGLYLSDNANVVADHLTVSNIDSTGVHLASPESELTLDTLTTDADLPVRMRLLQTEGLSGELELTGALASIYVDSGTISAPTTVPGYPYFLVDRQAVASDLTIQPGAELVFDQNAYMDVNGGSLNAVGTEALPIVFRGDEPLPGFWTGIRFTNSLSASNVLDHVSILDAGGEPWTGASHTAAGLTLLGDDVRLTMSNSRVANSEDAALLFEANAVSSRVSIETSTFETSTEPAKISINAIKSLGAGNVFTGNDDDRIRIFQDTTADEDAVWSDVGVPYFFSQNSFVEADIEIEPGVEMQFGGGIGMQIRSAGTLTVGETAAEMVRFTGASPVTGFWRGLYFNSSANANSITNARIEYAGSGPWNGNSSTVYALFATGDSRLDLTDTTFADNDNVADVFFDGESTLTGCTGVVGTIDGDSSATFCTN